MPSGQVSVWVPIVVAVLGIVGIIGGQLINSWREDRRWNRELEREDLRWQRERERDDLKHAHDARMEWRSQRFDTYKLFVAAIDEFLGALPASSFGRVDMKQRTQDHEMKGKVGSSLTVVKEAAVAVELLATESIIEAVGHTVAACDEARRAVWMTPREEGKIPGPGTLPDWDAIDKYVIQKKRILRKEREGLVKAVKIELALSVSKGNSSEILSQDDHSR